jgi:aldehyde:ferredoxin oxidoreductase
MGKLLRVDLTQRTIKEEPLDEESARLFLGGSGLGTKIIHDEVPGDTDPLGPDNKLLFMTGPLTGTPFPTTTRYEVCTKSPLTNMWLAASSAGWWARDFKLAGYDGLIVEGRADSPVYIWIKDGKAEIRDAGALWGLDSDQTQEAIRAELGDKDIKISCIGPAGEKQVLLACVMNDEQRAAGRGGAGAVMGSKNLKAVAVRGTGKVPVADEAALKQAAKNVREAIKHHPVVSQFTPYGTAGLLEHSWVSGDTPNKNWAKGEWREGCEKLNGRTMAETILVPHPGCHGCFIRCARWIKIDKGRFAMEGPGPEYETLAAFGTMLMNDNLEAVCWANDLANRYGVDTISTGGAIAFAMECYEKGIITREQAGCDLTWGNVDAIFEMIEQIGERRGLGALLGQGVKRASAELGQGTEDFAVHVKGLEVPYHDSRAYTSMVPVYATGTRGACHMHGAAFVMEQGRRAPIPEYRGRDRQIQP